MNPTLKLYIDLVGSSPEYDDIERTFCPEVGSSGHYCCGWCLEHWKPRFLCGCMFIPQSDSVYLD